jgi:Cu+-exporting ATPase
MEKMISVLQKNYEVKLLSGDNNKEVSLLKNIFHSEKNLSFNQSPIDKLNFIKKLQHKGLRVLMIGDGLNDAGALLQSDVGIAISNNSNCFTPASDAILDAENISLLPQLLNYCTKHKLILYTSFILSILYNCVGLFFAVQGLLQPLAAAILMPLSSLSIIVVTSVLNNFYCNQIQFIKS